MTKSDDVDGIARIAVPLAEIYARGLFIGEDTGAAARSGSDGRA
ncbi:hypothetical protein [Cnuibacter physcomitrellae]|nr:hypothetical protein [Cnuibacter physcomitrellae]